MGTGAPYYLQVQSQRRQRQEDSDLSRSRGAKRRPEDAVTFIIVH
jgi:hypothetical protein